MKLSRQTVREFFAMNEGRGVDLRRVMLWGYFFRSAAPEALDPLRRELELAGYAYVENFETEDGAAWLQVSRSEWQSADQLYRRCERLDELARRSGVELDGFDVGNVDGSVLLPADEAP